MQSSRVGNRPCDRPSSRVESLPPIPPALRPPATSRRPDVMRNDRARARARLATRIDHRGATGRHAPLSIVRPIKLLPGNVPQRFRDYAVSPEGDRAMPANPPRRASSVSQASGEFHAAAPAPHRRGLSICYAYLGRFSLLKPKST